MSSDGKFRNFSSNIGKDDFRDEINIQRTRDECAEDSQVANVAILGTWESIYVSIVAEDRAKPDE